MALTTGTVTADVRLLGTGQPASGRLVFRPVPCRLADRVSNVFYLAAEVGVELATGKLSVELAATDNPDLSVAEPWQWSVRFVLLDLSLEVKSFAFSLPAGTTVDLADVAPPQAWPR